MTEQNEWVSEDANQNILQGIYDFIGQQLNERYGSQRAQEIDRAIHQAQATLEQQHADWIDDEPSRFHLRFMALLLAAYRTLMELMPKEEALAQLTRAAIEPNRATIGEGVKAALDYAPDPMRVLVDASKQREEYFFGQTFAFERHQDDQQAYILHVKRCFYHQFALAHDVPDLMQVLCEWDWIWAEAIEPARHGFSFELPTTLGYGSDLCRFCFRRLTQ